MNAADPPPSSPRKKKAKKRLTVAASDSDDVYNTAAEADHHIVDSNPSAATTTSPHNQPPSSSSPTKKTKKKMSDTLENSGEDQKNILDYPIVASPTSSSANVNEEDQRKDRHSTSTSKSPKKKSSKSISNNEAVIKSRATDGGNTSDQDQPPQSRSRKSSSSSPTKKSTGMVIDTSSRPPTAERGAADRSRSKSSTNQTADSPAAAGGQGKIKSRGLPPPPKRAESFFVPLQTGDNNADAKNGNNEELRITSRTNLGSLISVTGSFLSMDNLGQSQSSQSKKRSLRKNSGRYKDADGNSDDDGEEEDDDETDADMQSAAQRRQKNIDAARLEAQRNDLARKLRKQLREEHRKKYENGFEIKSPLTEEAIFVAPTDLMTEPRLRKSGSKDGGLNLSSRLSSSSSTSLPDWSNSSIATVSGRDVTNMATSKDDPARSRIKPSDFHEKYVAVGDRFVRVDDRSKGFKSRYSRKSTKDTFRKLHNVSMQATIWSRSFMEWVHHLFAGCCFFSLVFLPVTDVSNSPGTIAPPIFYNSSIFNITSTPSALQLFLGTYSNVALPMSWMFNILVTIVMFSVIDLFTNIMPKNHATDAEEVKRQQYISRKSRKMYISSLKVALVLATLVSFICTIVVIPIEDQLYESQIDVGGSIYGNSNWFFNTTAIGTPDAIGTSAFVTGNVLQQWRILTSIKNCFGLLSWFIFCLMMTLVEIIEEKYKPVPIDPEIGGVNDIDSLEFSEQDKLESETDHPTRHQHHLARFGGSRADRLADAA